MDAPIFLTLVTPHYKRPQHLAACLASVGAQTCADDLEHIVLPDHIGVGIEGMYARLAWYADAVHGSYVHILADDDVLASTDAVEAVRNFAAARDYPPVIIVSVIKHFEQGPLLLPRYDVEAEPPKEGAIDLGCLIVRSDVWKAHVHEYGRRYEGDYDFAAALWQAGHPFTAFNVIFLQGAVMRGRPE